MSRTLKTLILLTGVGLATGIPAAEASTADRLERKVYRLGVAALDAVDATPAQRKAILAVGRRAETRLAPYVDDFADVLRDAKDAWTAPTVTRGEVEAVRVDTITLLDQASADSVDLVVEAANVLTPAQRRQMLQAARRHGERLLD